jgi:hypothetical protein
MIKFFLKITAYLVCTFSVFLLIIYLSVKIKPDYFLGMKPSNYYTMRFQYSKINSHSNFKNIIIGDSKGSAALDPKTMGKNWLNLSLPGSDFFEGFLSLKYYLKQNKIDTLLMYYSIDYIEGKANSFYSFTIPLQFPHPGDLDSLEAVENKYGFLIHDDSPGNTFKVLSQKELSSKQQHRRLKYNHFPLAFRETFLDGLDELCSMYYFNQNKKNIILHDLKENLGQMTRGNSDFSNVNFFKNTNVKFSPNLICFSYLDSIMTIAKERKIVTYLVIAPLNQTTYNSYKNSIYESSANSFLNETLKKYSNLKIIHDPVFLPNSYFGDIFLHLNKKSLKPYTIYIRNYLSNLVAVK